MSLEFQDCSFDTRISRDKGSVSEEVAHLGGYLSGPDRSLNWELRKRLEPLIKIFLLAEDRVPNVTPNVFS